MRLLFAHGLESGPEGRKTVWLREAGHDVTAPDCRGLDLESRIEVLADAITSEDQPRIVVGSSFGGIAALAATNVAAQRGVVVPALVLYAPALQLTVPDRFGVSLAPPCKTIVVHGVRDDIIPIEVSRTWCRAHRVTLVECDDDHSLASSKAEVLAAIS
jgi:alpha/beta superfamily hydrolase